MNSQMKGYIGQDPEVPQVKDFLSSWSWGMPPSPRVDVFTDLAVPDPVLSGFFWKFHHAAIMDH